MDGGFADGIAQWSAPSCIATGGVGWGLQIGADITDFVIVLNSEDALRAFSIGGNVTIGGQISAAAGPIGTGGSLQATLAHPAPMFSYSKSKGMRFRARCQSVC
jgi:lipid-binding SYLF domain-containing protein